MRFQDDESLLVNEKIRKDKQRCTRKKATRINTAGLDGFYHKQMIIQETKGEVDRGEGLSARCSGLGSREGEKGAAVNVREHYSASLKPSVDRYKGHVTTERASESRKHDRKELRMRSPQTLMWEGENPGLEEEVVRFLK